MMDLVVLFTTIRVINKAPGNHIHLLFLPRLYPQLYPRFSVLENVRLLSVLHDFILFNSLPVAKCSHLSKWKELTEIKIRLR